MKFWQRAFLSILLLFVVCFYLSIFLVSSFSYRTSLNSERERSFDETFFIAEALKKEIQMIAQYGNELEYGDYYFFRTYTEYYKNRCIYLELRENNIYLSGNLPELILPDIYCNDVNQQVSTVVSNVDSKYMIVSMSFNSNSNTYTLIYAHDLKNFCNEHVLLSRFLILSGIVLSSLLAIGLYIILRNLSKPIEIMDFSTQKISSGDYSMRLCEKGNDEFSALSKNFNIMADEIQRKISELDDTVLRKQTFIDNLAHELRTPLTVIHGYAEYLKNAYITEEDRVSSLNYIISETSRIDEMRNKLLDLALLRNSKIETTAVDLTDIIITIKCNFALSLKAKNINCDVKCVPIHVNGDRVLLESLIGNILDNAIKASYPGGNIEIYGYSEDNSFVIVIKDHGKGIPKENLHRLTEPFYRVDKSRSRAEGGAGLGLSLCKQIVDVHDAEIFFDSEIDNGTSVKLIFTSP